MAQPLLKKIQTIAAKTEATIGTPEALAAADGAINAYEIAANADIEVQQREGQGGFDMLTGVAGAQSGTLAFRTDIEWDGTSTLPAWLVTLWAACGIVETGTDTNIFRPVSKVPGAAATDPKTLTMARYINGVQKLLSGCMGTFEWIFPAGEMSYINWTFSGIWKPVTDVPIITPTYPRDYVWRYANATTTLGGTALCFSEGTFNPQNNVVMRECGTTAEGYENALITSRDAIFTMDPETTLMATKPNYPDWVANVERAFAIKLNGPSPSDTQATLALDAPKAQYRTLTEGDRDGIEVDETELQFNKNDAAQDQAFEITFTPSTTNP